VRDTLGKNKNKAKAASGNGKNSAEKPEKHHETTMEFIGSMAAVLVSGLFIITFILQAFEIPSESMMNTLLVGDHLFVDRVSLAPKTQWVGPLLPYGKIKRGDIIVFIAPAQAGLYLVKRVRGVPGDRIRLVNGKLYVNGELQIEPFVVRNGTYSDYRDNFPSVPASEMYGATEKWSQAMTSYVQNGELVVPPDSYFAMGDNRDNSLDSRYWGFVPQANLIGRPMFIYWSFKADKSTYEPSSFGERLANIGYTILHFFDKTRWSRTLNMVH
jgi:signal peptidase I